jgi:hypothetical protein
MCEEFEEYVDGFRYVQICSWVLAYWFIDMFWIILGISAVKYLGIVPYM